MNFIEHSISTDVGLLIEGFGASLFDLSVQSVSQKFQKNNFLLFRHFEVDVEGFKKFSGIFSTEFFPYVGGAYSREVIGGDKTVLSVTGHQVGNTVPFHGEMYYKKQKPDMMWFFCVNPANQDGETTLCDGSRVYEELSPATQQLFRQHNIKYIRTYQDGAWQQIYQTGALETVEDVCQVNGMSLKVNDDGSITTEYVCSALVTDPNGDRKLFINNILPVYYQELFGKNNSLVRFEDGSKIPDAVIQEVRAVTDRLTIKVEWQAGDIVMLDNLKLMHGRRAFSDPDREIYVRLCHRKLDL